MENKIKVLHVNTYTYGGAANACIELHLGLLDQGIDSHLLTLYPSKQPVPQHTVFPVKHPPRFQKVIGQVRAARNRKKDQRIREFCKTVNQEADYFSFINSPYDITQLAAFQKADIVNLHWVGDFLDWPTFFGAGNEKKIVWTLHDMSPFTGGYHFANGYTGYQQNDQNYPPATDTKFPQLAANLLKRKKEILKTHRSRVQIVSPSRWLSEVSASSALFNHYSHAVIPNSINSTIFKPSNKVVCREILNLPSKSTLLLSVSHDLNKPRKGFKILLDSFSQYLPEQNVRLCAVGANSQETTELSSNFIALGELPDPRLMAIAYNAADAFVISSVEDNLPNTMLEALMCGTPVIGFAVGGIKDAIHDGINGRLSEEITAQGLAVAINRFIAQPDAFNSSVIRQDAMQRYAPRVQAEAYATLYQKLLNEG